MCARVGVIDDSRVRVGLRVMARLGVRVRTIRVRVRVRVRVSIRVRLRLRKHSKQIPCLSLCKR